MKDTDELEFTISEVLRKTATSTEFNFNESIIKHEENIDFIAANLTLTILENDLMQTLAREYVLKKFVSSLNEVYDYIIIDCSPSLNLLTINALACCDEVIIPVQAQYLPVKGMEQLFFTIANIAISLEFDIYVLVKTTGTFVAFTKTKMSNTIQNRYKATSQQSLTYQRNFNYNA